VTPAQERLLELMLPYTFARGERMPEVEWFNDVQAALIAVKAELEEMAD
jgi:hypothetical protein